MCQELQLQLTAPEDGFVQVLVANESSVDVWFDDIEITYTPSMIVQEAHYDPWGMSLTGIEKEGNFGYLFNLSEKQKDPTGSGYFYETDWRGYDPQIGRFRGIDMYAGSMPGITPYQYAFNNPVMMNDPSGLIPLPLLGKIATASLPEFTFVGYKIFIAPAVAKSIATGIGLTFTSMAGGGLGAGGCNCGCPNPPCNGDQAAQGAQTSQTPQQGFVPPAGFTGPTVKQGANKVVKQVGKQAVNAVAKQVIKTGARMLLTFGSAPIGELLSPTPTGGSFSTKYAKQQLDKVKFREHQYDRISAEELRDIVDAVNRGIADSYQQNVYDWFKGIDKKMGVRESGIKHTEETHHYIPWRNTKHTDQYERITNKYELDLDDDWNKGDFSTEFHRGGHPETYHQFILNALQWIDNTVEAQGGDLEMRRNKFLELFELVKQEVRRNPGMLK